MTSPLSSLEPASLWRHFDRLRSLPRSSGEEGAAREYIEEIARARGWAIKKDNVGNLCIRVPATQSRDKRAPVILQAHLDMVCEKDSGTDFDFSKSPIALIVDHDWVAAKGTTLGADDGIGVAAALAVCEASDCEHGPVELLFTVDEEASGRGASDLDTSMVEGRRLVNLDAVDDTVVVVGCAGGCDTEIEFGAKREACHKGYVPLRVQVRGLRGGHSGLDIHEGRGNAIRILARVLRRMLRKAEIFLGNIEGGNKHNAIPREASAIVHGPSNFLDQARAIVEEVQSEVHSDLRDIDPGLRILIENVGEQTVLPFACSSTRRLVRLLNALPNGVLAVGRDVAGTVHSSTSLATMRTDIDRVTVISRSRSQNAAGLRNVLDQIDAVSRLAGAATSEVGAYPCWRANLSSPILNAVKAAYRDVNGADPRLSVIHAGVECGIFGQKLTGVDLVSLGPLIQGAHAPGERVSISSVKRFYGVVKSLLQRLD